MLVDQTDREDWDNARLARICPEAYKAKMKAMVGWNPIGVTVAFFRDLFAKRAR
jgi:hypothetical protein